MLKLVNHIIKVPSSNSSLVFFLLILCIGCRDGQPTKLQSQDTIGKILINKRSKWIKPSRQLSQDSIWSDNLDFIADSLLHGHKSQLSFYLKKYSNDTCIAMVNSKAGYLSHFDGIKPLGIIGPINKKYSVFVLERFNWCGNNGQSYYFTDTSLPRLETDSYCCHPDNLFVVGDIDEDGISEIGQWNSGCSSKYKGLNVWSLKKGSWQNVGSCGILSSDYFLKKQRIKKTGKGEFEMLEILDNRPGHNKGRWLQYKIYS